MFMFEHEWMFACGSRSHRCTHTNKVVCVFRFSFMSGACEKKAV